MPRPWVSGSPGLCIGAGLAWLMFASGFAWAQSSPRASGVPRALTIHFEGPPTRIGYARVIEALGEAQLIRFKLVLDDQGSVAAVMKNNDMLPRGILDPYLDRYLCRMNAHICHVEPAVNGGEVARWSNVKAPPDAAPPPPSCPGVVAPFALCLPDVNVFSYSTTARVHYDATSDRLDRVVKDAGGCRRLDRACRSQLVVANYGHDVLASDFRGGLSIPIIAYGLRLEVSSQDVLERAVTVVDRAIAQLTDESVVRQGEGAVYYTVSSAAVQKYDALLLPPPDLQEDGQSALAAMSYPRNFVPPATTQVGIWDTHVDIEHCDLAANGARSVALAESLPADENDPEMPSRQTGCVTVVPKMRSKKWDHGTFVTGIVAAPSNGQGVTGVNPKARVWAYEFRGSRLDTDVDPITRVRDSGVSPQVINMSFTEESQRFQTPLESLIKRWSSVLFVAAAGQRDPNDPIQAQVTDAEDCRVSPACLSASGKLPNLISVVPLKADGTDILPDTQEGQARFGPVFDVAAVGETTGLLYGNVFGPMSGSSVAAPYVTGLASLIFAKEAQNGASAKQVRDRILFTADLSDTLDSLVRSGRVNFDRALKTDKELLELKPSAGGPTQERAVKTQKTASIMVQDGESEGQRLQAPVSLRLSQLRRLLAHDDTPTSAYWVVYLDQLGVLRKISNATFAVDVVLPLRVTGEGAALQPITLTNVKDYSCSLACQ